MPPDIPEWRKKQLNTRSSNEAAGKIKEAAKWWWGDNPKDIATQALQDYIAFGVVRKGLKLGKKGLESKAVQDLIKKSNQQGDEIVKMVQSKWSKTFPSVKPQQFTPKDSDYYNKAFNKLQYGHSTPQMGTPAEKKKFEKLQKWMREKSVAHQAWEDAAKGQARRTAPVKLAPTPTRLKPQGKPNIIKTPTPKPDITITMKKPYKQPKKRRKTNVELGKHRGKRK